MFLQGKVNGIPLVLLGILFLGLMVFSGCDSDREPTSSGDGGDTTAEFSLSTPTATPTNINEGENSIIEVIATDDLSDPVEGVTVTFEVSPSSGGYFTPPYAETGANGIATSVFTSSNGGTMSIRGVADGANSPYTAITVASTGQETSGNVSIGVTPSLLTADGVSDASVTITVQDAENNPAPEGTLVKLTAGERFADVDGNGYYTNNVDSILVDYNSNETWDAIGMIPSTATTNAAGTVVVTYTAGTEATTAYIRATVTDADVFNGWTESSLTLTPDAAIYAIELSTDVTGLQVRHTGGVEFTYLHAICYDVNGNTVPEGLLVNFLIADGPDGGENLAGQGIGPVTAYTDANGIATVPVWSGTISGTLRLYASSATVLSNATFLAVYAGPPYYIAVGADFCNMDGWNTVNREMYVNAAVADIYHNPVQDTTVVYFTVDEGIIDAYGITSDSTGVASAIFRTGEPQVNGVVWIWGETSGGTVVGSSFFYNSHIPATITLWMTPQMLLANGKTKATFWADVRDLNGNFVVGGTTVDTKTLYGSASAGSTEDGCYASIFEGEYSSATLDQDFSVTGVDDDGIGAIDIISARSGFVGSNVVCTLTTAFANAEKSSITLDAASVSFGATGVPIRCVVMDRYSNPLADHTLTASISNGSIVPGTESQETNTFGEAFGFAFNAPADSTGGASAVITITDSDPRSGGMVLSTSVNFSAK